MTSAAWRRDEGPGGDEARALAKAGARGAWLRIGGMLVVAVIAFVLAWRFGWLDARRVMRMAERMRERDSLPIATAAFVLVFGVAVSIGLPATPFMIVGGALFGLVGGAIVNSIAVAVGALGGYALARWVGSERVAHLLARFRSARVVGECATFGSMLRLRLVPVIPFAVLSYAAGFGGAPIARYTAATVLGALPTGVIYSYFAATLLEGLAGRGGGRSHVGVQVAIASLLLLAMSLVPTIAARLRRRRELRAATLVSR